MNPAPRPVTALVSTRLADDFARDVAAGLLAPQKRIPSKYFYDEAGSRLFEAICDLPEYYLTRTERGILEAHADDMVARLGRDARLVELGAGSAVKTRILIEALVRRDGQVAYTPIDISGEAMRTARDNISSSFPRTVRFEGLVGDYHDALARLTREGGEKLVLFLGSSIGNFTVPDATRFLRRIRDALGPRDLLLLGTDLAKDPAELLRAYDDAAGVTARFNRNLLVRANRELGADFDVALFHHEARWDPTESRIEMHLVAETDHTVHLAALGLDVPFRAGESIHTEDSYKYTDHMVRRMTHGSRFRPLDVWTDPDRRFALHLLAPVP